MPQPPYVPGFCSAARRRRRLYHLHPVPLLLRPNDIRPALASASDSGLELAAGTLNVALLGTAVLLEVALGDSMVTDVMLAALDVLTPSPLQVPLTSALVQRMTTTATVTAVMQPVKVP